MKSYHINVAWSTLKILCRNVTKIANETEGVYLKKVNTRKIPH